MFLGICESLRYQEFLDGKMRELYYLTASLIDDADQTGARGQHQTFCVQWPRTFLGRCGCCRIELDRQNRCEFLDEEWANGHQEALEQPFGIFSFLIIDVPQYSLVGF